MQSSIEPVTRRPSGTTGLSSCRAAAWAKGRFLGSKAVVPAIEKGGGGSIINISSMNGMVAHMPGQTAYATSKGAVRLFTKALALEVVAMNIRVNSIHLGVISSPFVAPYLEDPATRSTVLARTLMQRPGTTNEVAKVVAFLAFDDAYFITGSEVSVDGGFLSA
jgi:NAD(P)-dependent dehydrogenase (short-subunit alcohol dehydrogenase family)